MMLIPREMKVTNHWPVTVKVQFSHTTMKPQYYFHPYFWKKDGQLFPAENLRDDNYICFNNTTQSEQKHTCKIVGFLAGFDRCNLEFPFERKIPSIHCAMS